MSFEVSPTHPHLERVQSLLEDVRHQANELWNEVESYNREHPLAEEQVQRVYFYAGQYIEDEESELTDDASDEEDES